MMIIIIIIIITITVPNYLKQSQAIARADISIYSQTVADRGHTLRSAEMSGIHVQSKMCRKRIADTEKKHFLLANIFSLFNHLRWRPQAVVMFGNLPYETTTYKLNFWPIFLQRLAFLFIS